MNGVAANPIKTGEEIIMIIGFQLSDKLLTRRLFLLTKNNNKDRVV
jgi:hypothetical protein